MTRTSKVTLVAFCPACGTVGDTNKRLSHTFGCDQPTAEITDRIQTIRWRRERKLDGWYAEDVDWLLRELASYTSVTGPDYEAMWNDAVRHRDTAEARARRYQDSLQAIAAIVCPEEEPL